MIDFDKYKKNAFTLAEVLITLMIIGVVAALTIPNLMQAWEEQALKTQFKKTYSTLNQALYLVLAENSYNCYYPISGSSVQDDCKVFWDAMYEKLNVVKRCKNKPLENGCIIPYEFMQTTSVCNYYQDSYFYIYADVALLSDGAIISPYAARVVPVLFIDVNGTKSPNQIGKDVFSIMLVKNKNGNISFPPNDRSGGNVLYSCLGVPSDCYLKDISDVF